MTPAEMTLVELLEYEAGMLGRHADTAPEAATLRARAERLRKALERARADMAVADCPDGFTVQKRTLVEQTLLAINAPDEVPHD